jgi:hypothetical protein
MKHHPLELRHLTATRDPGARHWQPARVSRGLCRRSTVKNHYSHRFFTNSVRRGASAHFANGLLLPLTFLAQSLEHAHDLGKVAQPSVRSVLGATSFRIRKAGAGPKKVRRTSSDPLVLRSKELAAVAARHVTIRWPDLCKERKPWSRGAGAASSGAPGDSKAVNSGRPAPSAVTQKNSDTSERARSRVFCSA